MRSFATPTLKGVERVLGRTGPASLRLNSVLANGRFSWGRLAGGLAPDNREHDLHSVPALDLDGFGCTPDELRRNRPVYPAGRQYRCPPLPPGQPGQPERHV